MGVICNPEFVAAAGILPAGQIAGLVYGVLSVREIIAEMVG
jgi:hypothetical protein